MQATSSGTKFVKFASISNEQWMSISKEKEKTSDSHAVWLALTANHGGEIRWEQCYAKLSKISSQIVKFRRYPETHVGAMNNILKRLDLVCEYVTHFLLDNNNTNLKAMIAQIWADLPGLLGCDFQACCSLIVPVDPVEKKLTKNGTKRCFYTTLSAS